MERAVLHSDLNSFFASVECRDAPQLKGKPVAVCGSTQERHGIVLAKTEEAKRCGVKTGETVWQAKRKCPELIMVAPHMERYVQLSAVVRQIYERYTDRVEPYGIDECFIDVTGCGWMFGSGLKIAREIRQKVKEETRLTVSIGVSYNKIFAKMGSDMKKPDAITEITRENYREKVWTLPVREMFCLGPRTERKLWQLGIHTIGELANTEAGFLAQRFGKYGAMLWQYANGNDSAPVVPAEQRPPAKSVSHGATCVRDLTGMEEVRHILFALSQRVARRLREEHAMANRIHVMVRDSELEFHQYTKELPAPMQNAHFLARAGAELVAEQYSWEKPVRSLTICAFDFLPEEVPVQTSLFFDCARLDRCDRVERVMEQIQDRFGKNAILPASLYNRGKLPGSRGWEKTLERARAN